MPAHRYVEEDKLAAIPATKRSAGVTPEVDLGEHVTHMPPSSVNKATHSGFETQRRCHQKSKTGGYQWPHKKDLCLQKKFKNKFWRINYELNFDQLID